MLGVRWVIPTALLAVATGTIPADGGRRGVPYQDHLRSDSFDLPPNTVPAGMMRLLLNASCWKAFVLDRAIEPPQEWATRSPGHILLLGRLSQPYGCANHEIRLREDVVEVSLLPPSEGAPAMSGGCAIQMPIISDRVEVRCYWSKERIVVQPVCGVVAGAG